jgi:hypothetical protein
MAPFKSTLARSVGKLLGVFNERDLSFRGTTNSSRIPITTEVTGGNAVYTVGTKKIHVFTSSGALSVTSALGSVAFEYVLIAGGGGTANDNSGGGGAGGVISNISGIMPVTRSALSMDQGQNVTVTIGNGGPIGNAGQPDSPAYPGGRAGGNGFDTLYAGPGGNSVRALGGGAGGQEGNPGPSNLPVPASSGGRGGSAGGARGGRSESAQVNGIDNQGGTGSKAVGIGGVAGIGGGAGGGAGAGASDNIDGGIGIQLPTAFRDNSQPSAVKGDPAPGAPSSGGWYFAGGGGARTDPGPGNTPTPKGGPLPEGGHGGGGQGRNYQDAPNHPQTPGQANTGGGGGGGSGGSTGGSGIAFFMYTIS